VYDRTVKDRPLTFCVSGKLWNRSLIMKDLETQTLWSHLLGEAVEGSLKGEKLRALPCDMMTWDAWFREHPETTVLNMARTTLHYTREFYEKRSDRVEFVVGFTGNYGMHHCSFETLKAKPLLNVDARGLPLVILFQPDSTSARIFNRRVGDRTLTFVAIEADRMQDQETHSLWHARSGLAVGGALQGERLEPHVGIVSVKRAWQMFHPDSREVEANHERHEKHEKMRRP
jgi:hypothetical protein